LQPKQRGAFTQALMELGATICIPNGTPACGICPLNDLCKAFRSGTAMDLPVRAAKKEKREEKITVLILTCNGKYAIRRRQEKGLLAGMWEPANVQGWLTASEATSWAKTQGFHPTAIPIRGRKHHHVFTHIRWLMQSYQIECGDIPTSFIWATPEELSEVYAFPAAFRPFLP
jgi:A/G-specific adenine glycosylase